MTFRWIRIGVALLANALAFVLWYIVKEWYDYLHPIFFYGLLFIPLLSLWFVFGEEKRTVNLKMSSLKNLSGLSHHWMYYLGHLLFLLRVMGVTLLVIALARPQSRSEWSEVTTDGIDIIISLDISGSMLARDFSPNRLEASKKVAIDFVRSRPNDRIGLVVYEGESFTQCPLTTDHQVLMNLFSQIRTGQLEGGTAVGMGLATAVNRLRNSDAKSKVIILLTDGVSNSGAISPLNAADIAKQYGIRVYTIGVGKNGMAPFPAIDQNGRIVRYVNSEVKIDEATLKQIAKSTQGKYFRATNAKKLREIYTEIDQLEKTRFEVTEHSRKSEEFFIFALIGSALLLMEFLIKKMVFRFS